MKTAQKVLIAIGAVTAALISAAIIVCVICSDKKKYYPVSKKTIEI